MTRAPRGAIRAEMLRLRDGGVPPEALRARLAAIFGDVSAKCAIERARRQSLLPPRVKRHPGRLIINLPPAAGRRLAARADAEGMTQAQLAKVILHRASRVIDTMELHQ